MQSSYVYDFISISMTQTENDQYKESLISETDTHKQALLDVRKKSRRFDSLTDIQIWAYGVGHFINDLVAACWFNYLFFFLKRIVQTPAASAAILSGQITDGIATPIVGYLSDKIKTRFGQRTPWYIFGLVLVSACYLPIYQTFHSDNKTNEYIYYIIFPSLFNVGWASLQISHMSLVPSLTCSRKRRDKLNNLRNTFTFVSSFVVLGLGLIIFSLMSNPELQYALISYIVLAMGICASIFFLYHIRQVPLTEECLQKAQKLKKQVEEEDKVILNKNSNVQFSQDEDNLQGIRLSKNERIKKKQSILNWFKMPKFYLFGICYMGVRLYANMFGTLLPFYLVGVLNLGLDEQTSSSVPFTVALVPLIVYLSSVLVSSKLNWFYEKFGRKKALFVGTLISLGSIIPMFFLTKEVGWIMYILAVFVGVSQTMVLATGINFISDVVGTKAKTGAFVFGIYSLLDKFSAGITIFLIGNTEAYSKDAHDLDDSEKMFLRYTMVLIPCLSSILATAIVLSYPIKEYKKNDKISKQKNPRSSISEQLVS